MLVLALSVHITFLDLKGYFTTPVLDCRIRQPFKKRIGEKGNEGYLNETVLNVRNTIEAKQESECKLRENFTSKSRPRTVRSKDIYS